METHQCSSCHSELPIDGKTRKRNRSRKCTRCNTQAAMKRRREDPIRLLSHRFNNACRRGYKNPSPHLWSTKTVSQVFRRFEGKSCISGESDAKLLCIFPLLKSTGPPSIDDLVLVTSREAQSISRCKNNAERLEKFPRHIQEMRK